EGGVTNGSVTPCSFSRDPNGQDYSFTVTPSGQGLVTVKVNAGVASDAAGNGNTAATSLSRTFDSVQPSVTLTSTAPNPTNTAPIPVKAHFSKPVADFIADDVTITGGTLTAGSFNANPHGGGFPFPVTPPGQGGGRGEV